MIWILLSLELKFIRNFILKVTVNMQTYHEIFYSQHHTNGNKVYSVQLWIKKHLKSTIKSENTVCSVIFLVDVIFTECISDMFLK